MNNNYKAIVRINNDRDNAPTNPHFPNPALYLHLIEDAGNNSNDSKNVNNNTAITTTTSNRKKNTKIPILPTWSFSHT